MLAEYRNLPRVVYVLCLGTIINRCAYFVVTFLSSYVNSTLKLGPEVATWAVGCFGLGSITAAFVGGYLADVIGRKIVAMTALFGSACMVLVLSQLRTPTAILVGVFAFALLNDMYRPAVSAMLTDAVDADRRPAAFGLMYLAINLGAAIAPLIGGPLAKLAFTYLFWADATTSIAYGLIIAFVVRETLRKEGVVGPGSVASGGSSVAGEASVARRKRPDGFAVVVRDRLFLTVCLATLFVSLTYVQTMSTFPIYLEQLGYGAETYGRLVAINGAMIVLLQVAVTRLVTRFDRGVILSLAAIVTAAGFGATGLASVPWQFAITVVIWTTGEMMQSPILHTVAAELAPSHLRARYFGAITMCFSGANLLAASVSGLVLSRYGGSVLWGSSFVIAAIGAALYASTIPALRNRRAHHAPETA